MRKIVDALLYEAQQYRKNMNKTSYDKKELFSNFYFCMKKLRSLPKDKIQREQFRKLERSYPL